jgi:hypothetical protein
MRKHSRKHSRTRRGGGPFPLHYYGAPAISASAGHDLLEFGGLGIRPRIGGKRKTRKTRKGGFYPSVMGNFLQCSSKYITPIALYAGYKLLTKNKKRKTRR